MLATSTNPLPPLCHRADPRDPDAADRCWWLCYAQVRHEKAIAAELLAADVPHLLPLARVEGVTPKGRRRNSIGPLFPGYLFVAGDEFDRLNAMAAVPGRLLYTIPVFDVATLMADLANLVDAIEAGAPLGKARPPAPGARVRVVAGPWEGTEGTLVREKGRDVLLLHVRAINRVVELAVESWRCEVIEARP